MLLVVVSLVAVVGAQYAPPHPPYAPHTQTIQGQKSSGFNNGGFLSGFSDQMEQLGRDMQHMHLELAQIIPTAVTTQTQYILNYQLSGFHKEDIEVEVKKGTLIVKAIQRSGPQTRSQINQMNLPEYVNPNGTWAFIGEILRVVFPLKNNYQQPNTDWSSGQNVGNAQGTGETPGGNANTGTKKQAVRPFYN